MPPKPKITKEMVINAGLETVRRKGINALSVRGTAERLSCSTQPVMSCCGSIEQLKKEVYEAADKLHTEYILKTENEENTLISIGINYVRFASEEPNLFCFLFETGKFRSRSFEELIASDGPDEVIEPISRAAGLPEQMAREAFESLFACVHGYASLLAHNAMSFDEEHCRKLLKNTFMGIIGYMKGESRNEEAV
ncbi:MAG: WHG domain-containing protein [Ruminococcus sp.]|nr:WHG domain-containing protein [Ruminococcus sp.]